MAHHQALFIASSSSDLACRLILKASLRRISASYLVDDDDFPHKWYLHAVARVSKWGSKCHIMGIKVPPTLLHKIT
jgi:hypothetical protein